MSWDDNNITAVLVTCAVCHRPMYMTVPHEVCLVCRDREAREQHARIDLLERPQPHRRQG